MLSGSCRSPSAADRRRRPDPCRRTRPRRSSAARCGFAASPARRRRSCCCPRTRRGGSASSSIADIAAPACSGSAWPRHCRSGSTVSSGLPHRPGVPALPFVRGVQQRPVAEERTYRWWPCAIRCTVASDLGALAVGHPDGRRGQPSRRPIHEITGSPRSISGCRKAWSRRQDMITKASTALASSRCTRYSSRSGSAFCSPPTPDCPAPLRPVRPNGSARRRTGC